MGRNERILVVGGALLLIGRFVPLGLTLLGPIIVNIVLFHIFMDRSGLLIALFISLLWLFLLWRYRAAFAGILQNTTESGACFPQQTGRPD
jgi:putative oxidoreductase